MPQDFSWCQKDRDAIVRGGVIFGGNTVLSLVATNNYCDHNSK